MLDTGKGSVALYIQIKDLLVSRIGKGEWLPGKVIPSEVSLAREFGVSQGTVRTAITELVEQNVLTRKQGIGTFVSTHNNERALFHFFHITDNKGHKVLPDSNVLKCYRKPATVYESSRLQIDRGVEVVKIDRVRSLSGKPTLVENITLPASLFSDLGKDGNYQLPNTLYQLYEKQYGIAIHSADEQIRAVKASRYDCSVLGLQPDTPLLSIERVARTLDKTPIELRISRCSTKNYYYHNSIS